MGVGTSPVSRECYAKCIRHTLHQEYKRTMFGNLPPNRLLRGCQTYNAMQVTPTLCQLTGGGRNYRKVGANGVTATPISSFGGPPPGEDLRLPPTDRRPVWTLALHLFKISENTVFDVHCTIAVCFVYRWTSVYTCFFRWVWLRVNENVQQDSGGMFFFFFSLLNTHKNDPVLVENFSPNEELRTVLSWGMLVWLTITENGSLVGVCVWLNTLQIDSWWGILCGWLRLQECSFPDFFLRLICMCVKKVSSQSFYSLPMLY